MSNPVKLAFIGCGGMAGAHCKGLQTLWEAGLRDFEVSAACDVEHQQAEKMAEAVAAFTGAKPAVYDNVEQMLAAQPALEAVDICTTHRTHHTTAVPCLEAGKHVTIEKPLAITMRAGWRIVEAAARNGRLLQVAENYRRYPAQRAIRWALEQGRIGALRMLYWIDIGERLWYWGWREHKEQAGGGWSLDGGVHFADLFRYHVGELTTIYAASKAYSPIRYRKPETLEDPIQATVEDTTIAVLHFQNGVTGQWTSTGAAPGGEASLRALYGDRGSICWKEGLRARGEKKSLEELEREFMACLSVPERDRLFPAGVTDSVATELQEFLRAVRGKGEIETDGMAGLKAEAISMALYESAWLGEPVAIKDVENCQIEGYQAELNLSLGL